MSVTITVSAQFTDSNGTPATGLILTEVDITLVSIRKSDGAEVTIWAALDAIREVTGLGMYQKDYASADLDTYWYFAMAEYVGATVLDSDFAFGVIGEVALDVNGRVDVGDWLGQAVTLSANNNPDVNVDEISDDLTAPQNLELQYDTTGLVGDTFPGTQAQLGNLANVGAAINTAAESYLLTTGTQSSGTFSDTAALDAVYHQHTDTVGAVELYYQFDVGGDGVPTSVTITGRINGNNDDLDGIYAYNWGGTSWDRVGDFDGQATSTDVVRNYDLFTSHVGTGANLGKVRIRFFASAGLTTATLSVDQIFTSYAVVARSVGYADGAIWINTNASNTNTEAFVDGTADNPVSTWAAALTLSGNLNITRFHIINGSTITLTGNSDNYTLIGSEWTLALGGQSIASAHIEGATVSGTAVGNDARFIDCHMGTVTLARCEMDKCAIAATLTLSATDTYLLDSCWSAIAGSATPTINFGAAIGNTALNMRHYSGGIELENMGVTGTDTMSLEGHGQLIINANCVAGTVAIRGHFTVTDNAGGALTLSDDARIDVDQINAEVDTALSDYDGPTNAEMVARTLVAASYGTAANQATLLGVIGALTDIAAADDPTVSDTIMQYVKQLINILVGTAGVVTFPASAAPGNGVSLAEVIRSIYDDSNELQGDWVDTGRLDTILDARASQTTVDAIETDTQDIQSRLPAALVSGRMDSDIRAINGNTDSSTKLALSADTMETGIAIAGTLSTTEMTTNLTEVTDNHYNGRVLIWTSGTLLRQVASITGYDGTSKKLTFTAVTEAPIANDTWIMV